MYNGFINGETQMNDLIHYDQIGTLAWCDQYRDSLDELMEKALSGDNDAALIVVNCAAHFYGLVICDFGSSVEDLIDAIKGLDQNTEFA